MSKDRPPRLCQNQSGEDPRRKFAVQCSTRRNAKQSAASPWRHTVAKQADMDRAHLAKAHQTNHQRRWRNALSSTPRTWETASMQQRRRGTGWKVIHHKQVEVHNAVKLHKLIRGSTSVEKRQRKGTNFHDPSSERQLDSRTAVRQALWEAHMKSPTGMLETLRRTEDGPRRARSSAAGGNEAFFDFDCGVC